MGEIIEFVFANLFFIIIVVAGLISALSKNKEAQKKSQQRSQRKAPSNHPPGRQPSRTQSPSPERAGRTVSDRQVHTDKLDKIGGSTSAAIEAQQRAQMENLEAKYGSAARDINTRDFSDHQFESTDTLKALDILSDEQEKLKSNLRGNLRKKGFINGVIMAEVLGKPRSLKQYRSPTMDRYEK